MQKGNTRFNDVRIRARSFNMTERYDTSCLAAKILERLLKDLHKDHAKDTKRIKNKNQHMKYNYIVKILEKFTPESKSKKLEDMHDKK